jgi:hypothetical protein
VLGARIERVREDASTPAATTAGVAVSAGA